VAYTISTLHCAPNHPIDDRRGTLAAQTPVAVMVRAVQRSQPIRWIAVAILAAAIPLAADCQTAQQLSAEQRALIDAGHQLFLTWDVPGSPWPRTCAFENIDASPEEAAAAFTNYSRQRAYIPRIRKSLVSRVVDPATAEVDYTLDVPMVADEDYTVLDRVSVDDGGASYMIGWTLVRATSTKAIAGSVRFESHRLERTQRDVTLMSYCNLVTPGSGLAKLSFVKSRALAQARDAAHAIVVEVERERTSDRALLDAEVERLRAALAATRPQAH
jgi:hypothetical protein